MPDKQIIDKLIKLEWKMFSSVNEGGPKADCQEDPDTFYGMRYGQFSAWSDEAVNCYLADVEKATSEGRNLAMEKYIHMMKTTQPSQYDILVKRCVYPSPEAVELAQKITDKLIAQTEVLHKEFPYVSGSGRPLYSTADFRGFISVETYQKGELFTYSLDTLKALWAHLCALEAEGKSLARNILENSVMHYGYKCLEDAEAAQRRYAESLPIEISYGCDKCGC